MENVATLITNLGFPICCVLGCAYFIYNNNKLEREENNKREDKMFSQLDKFNTTMERFNNTLTRVDTRLEILEKKVDKNS